jgi:hypothetical protein
MELFRYHVLPTLLLQQQQQQQQESKVDDQAKNKIEKAPLRLRVAFI